MQTLTIFELDFITLPHPAYPSLTAIDVHLLGAEISVRVPSAWAVIGARSMGRWDEERLERVCESGEASDIFRGTKPRYSVVAADQRYDEQLYGRQAYIGKTLTTPRSVPAPPPKALRVSLDLETLIYFHHFTAAASLKLPDGEVPQPEPNYSQTDVVALGFAVAVIDVCSCGHVIWLCLLKT